jgi:hypothetical protein
MAALCVESLTGFQQELRRRNLISGLALLVGGTVLLAVWFSMGTKRCLDSGHNILMSGSVSMLSSIAFLTSHVLAVQPHPEPFTKFAVRLYLLVTTFG